MSSFVAYQEMVAAQNSFDVFCKQNELTSYNIVPSIELRSNGILDSVVRFLKWLKYHVSELVRKVIRWISNALSYDNYIITKNSVRCNRIEKAYKKLDPDKKIKVDNAFANKKMSICWKKGDFINEIKSFQKICNYGTKDLIDAIKNDIADIVNGSDTWMEKISEMDTLYNIHFNAGTSKFSYKSKYQDQSGSTFNQLDFSNIDDVIELCKEYEKTTEAYKRIIDLPATLHKFEYQLDITLRNVQQDPMVADNVKNNMKIMDNNIKLAIHIARNYIDFVRNICTAINIRISAILNHARECIASYDKDFTKSGNEAYMKETTIVITSDDEFNKRYQMLSSAISCILDFNNDKIYPELTLQCEKVALKEYPGVHEFCKQQKDVAKLPIKLVIDPPNDVLKMDILADINRCVQNTGLIVSLDKENYLIASIYTDAPSMELLIDRANLICKL